MPDLSCSVWDLVPWPGIEPGPPALDAWSVSHWIAREVPDLIIISFSVKKRNVILWEGKVLDLSVVYDLW